LSQHSVRIGVRVSRTFRASRVYVLLSILLALGAILYLYHAFQYFLYDDEGGYAYAAWRVSLGEVPYRDFLTPQMPGFLYWGGLVVRFFGRSFVALRLASMVAVLVAAALLFAANRELFGLPTAAVSMALFLIEPNAFHNARFFRPEALMLAFQTAGLYAFVLGEKRRRRVYTALAGALFGLSALSKLFGLLPLAGCFLYLLYAWRREARSSKQALQEGLALGAPALLVVGVAAVAFTHISPYFPTAVLGHHTMQGAGMPFGERVGKAASLYWSYAASQPVALILAVVGAWLTLRQRQALSSWPAWSAPTGLAFVVLSRDLQLRHLAYLAPALATLVAVAVVRVLQMQRPRLAHPGLWRTAALLLAVGLVVGAAYPWALKNGGEIELAEEDSGRLSALIQRLASDSQIVMSDDPGLNFLAARRSTYWAAGISGGAAQSGQIRGAQLIDEIESQDVAVVVVNTWGSAHQMVAMVDSADFLDYVSSRFVLAERYKCVCEGRVFEVYARPDVLQPGWESSQPAPVAADGALIELCLRVTPSAAASNVRWQELSTAVQWQDGAGAWHDVDAWQGPPEVEGTGEAYRAWAVGPTDLGNGPFRWLVLRSRGGEVLAVSEPFDLPSEAGAVQRIQVTISP
jgi:4-amino-4-deoxy-L-arabinose transferase-like glycosyltransferase